MKASEAFAAYSDESGTFHRRYQAIGVVSGPLAILLKLSQLLKDILDNHGISEVKFTEIGTHGPKVVAAREFIRCVLKGYASRGTLRIDVLLWDTHDSRCAVRSRDDVANLERMYHKVLTHAGRQWNQIEWNLHPDINSQIDWNKIAGFLSKTRLYRAKPNLLTLFEDEESVREFQFNKIEPKESSEEPLIQLADLFAGLVRFSREEGEQCVQWLDSCQARNQPALPGFKDEEEPDETTLTKLNRFKLVGEVDNLCKRRKMRGSLRTRNYLWTPDPTYPLNFWHYEPQHQYDKAPVK
jgi:hypothetical protein